jgi:hypothetical protein
VRRQRERPRHREALLELQDQVHHARRVRGGVLGGAREFHRRSVVPPRPGRLCVNGT